MNKASILFATWLIFTAPNVMAEISLSNYAKVYKGGEGAVVTLIPLSPPAEKKALIHISGMDTEIDGLVLLYDLEDWGSGEAYVMTYDGSRRARLSSEKDYWTSWTTLFLPDHPNGIEVTYDEKSSKAAISGDFLKLYLKHKEKNIQQELARFKRDRHEARANADLLEKAKDTSAACGSEIKASIDWKSISDEALKELSIGSFCGSPLEGLAVLCKESEENKKTLARKVARVNCKFADKVHIDIRDRVLQWTTTKDTHNQDDFAKYVLMNEL